MNRIGFVALGFVLLGAVIAAADYLTLFGSKTTTRLDFVTARFRIVDGVSGAPVFGTRVRCLQRGNDNACTLKDTTSDDVLSVLFPRHTRLARTMLFTKREELLLPDQKELYIYFINTGYMTTNITVDATDILRGEAQQVTIKMNPRN